MYIFTDSCSIIIVLTVFLQLDESLVPFEWKGPLNSPPIKDYPSVDGEYTDTTPKYDK